MLLGGVGWNLGHDSIFINGLDTSLFDALGKSYKFLVAVEFTTVFKTSSPCENPTSGQHLHFKEIFGAIRSDRVSRSFFALLVFPVVSCDRPMRSFRLNGLAIRCDQYRRHQAKRSVALGDDIALDVSVVIFAGPDEPPTGFKGLSNHVVDKTVFIPNLLLFEFGFVVPIISQCCPKRV